MTQRLTSVSSERGGSPATQAARDAILHRKQSYLGTFRQEDEAVKYVLADLARFCRAGKSTFDADPRVHALLEGRKEVLMRILNNVNLSEHDLFEMYVDGK